MLKKGISLKFVRLMKDIYFKSKTCVQLDKGLSNTFDLYVGLKQGCNLSPIFFNLFVNDLITYINSANSGASVLENLKVSCLLYADDLVLISETKEGLQESLNALDQFTSDWFMQVNPEKTKCLLFSKSRKQEKVNYEFKSGKHVLENCTEYCYLGVIFVQSGSLKTASKALNDKAQGAIFSLLKDINKHHACKFDILLDLFDKMIVPIALYNSEVWGTNSLPTNTTNSNLFDTKAIFKLPIT